MKIKVRFPKWLTDTVDHNDPKVKLYDELKTMDYDELVSIAESENIDYTWGMDKADLAWMIANA